MALPFYLAMTAREYFRCRQLPAHCGWMACHFSPYGTGLTNLPQQLPPGSLLILNDTTPPRGHDPALVAQQLQQCVQQQKLRGVLLDLQTPYQTLTQQIVRQVVSTLTCPVAAPAQYAKELDCGILLPPVPPDAAPEAYLAPWKGKSLWLELDSACQCLTLTQQGCERLSCPVQVGSDDLYDSRLFCHYRICIRESSVEFYLYRTPEDQQALLDASARWGAVLGVGLYQEFEKPFYLSTC